MWLNLRPDWYLQAHPTDGVTISNANESRAYSRVKRGGGGESERYKIKKGRFKM